MIPNGWTGHASLFVSSMKLLARGLRVLRTRMWWTCEPCSGPSEPRHTSASTWLRALSHMTFCLDSASLVAGAAAEVGTEAPSFNYVVVSKNVGLMLRGVGEEVVLGVHMRKEMSLPRFLSELGQISPINYTNEHNNDD